METKSKCSFEEHKDSNAIKYCPKCQIYMCNKCEKTHMNLFKDHNEYKIENNDEEIFTGFCKEKSHQNILKYFCKDHNKLCCAACIAKINKKGDGQHKDCNICCIEDIKEEKKNKLVENIQCLQDLQDKFNESIKELKQIFEKIDNNKENLKLQIQKIFTKIRNAINDREDELIIEIDNIFNKKFINDDIINKGEKLPKKIKASLEKGKSLDKEWEDSELNSYINDCINIENNINDINIINDNIIKSKLNNNINIDFTPNEDSLDEFLDKIKSFGTILLNSFKFKECPFDIKLDRAYEVSGTNKNIFTKTGPDGWMGTICENELDKSIEEHKWKIKILNTTQYKNIMIGVAPSDFNISSSSYNSCGWYYYCWNSTLHSGPPQNYSIKNSGLNKVKDEIIIVMNMKKRTLKYIINNEDKGDSYNNIPIDKPLYPAVFLYNKNDSVQITEC